MRAKWIRRGSSPSPAEPWGTPGERDGKSPGERDGKSSGEGGSSRTREDAVPEGPVCPRVEKPVRDDPCTWGVSGRGAPGTNGPPLCAGEVHGQAGAEAGQPGRDVLHELRGALHRHQPVHPEPAGADAEVQVVLLREPVRLSGTRAPGDAGQPPPGRALRRAGSRSLCCPSEPGSALRFRIC